MKRFGVFIVAILLVMLVGNLAQAAEELHKLQIKLEPPTLMRNDLRVGDISKFIVTQVWTKDVLYIVYNKTPRELENLTTDLAPWLERIYLWSGKYLKPVQVILLPVPLSENKYFIYLFCKVNDIFTFQ